MRDLWQHDPAATSWDYRLLSCGRHYRLAPAVKLILSHNALEAEHLVKAAAHGQARPHQLIQPDSFPGPTALLVGVILPSHQQQALALIWRHSQAGDRERLWISGYGQSAQLVTCDRPEPTRAVPLRTVCQADNAPS